MDYKKLESIANAKVSACMKAPREEMCGKSMQRWKVHSVPVA